MGIIIRHDLRAHLDEELLLDEQDDELLLLLEDEDELEEDELYMKAGTVTFNFYFIHEPR